MAIPSILQIRKPLLEYLSKDKNFHSLIDCVDFLSNDIFQLTVDEKNKQSNGRKIFHKRVVNVVSQFRIAELIRDETKPGNASFSISEIGLKLLEQKDFEITNKILNKTKRIFK